MNKEKVDTAITEQLLGDIVSPEFVSKVTQATKEIANSLLEDPAEELRLEVANINKQISRAMDLAIKLDNPDPALKKINELEIQRKPLEDHIARLEREHSMQSALANITETQVWHPEKLHRKFQVGTERTLERIYKTSGRAHCARPRDFRLLYPLQVCGGRQAKYGVPKGSRTPVTAVKGRCPRPLDDGDV